MDVLPPEEALPLWQPAQVFAVGLEGLKDACDGVAETVATFSCAPNRARIRNEVHSKTSNGTRRFFNFGIPSENFFERHGRLRSAEFFPPPAPFVLPPGLSQIISIWELISAGVKLGFDKRASYWP